jgi:hypothetical protein
MTAQINKKICRPIIMPIDEGCAGSWGKSRLSSGSIAVQPSPQGPEEKPSPSLPQSGVRESNGVQETDHLRRSGWRAPARFHTSSDAAYSLAGVEPVAEALTDITGLGANSAASFTPRARTVRMQSRGDPHRAASSNDRINSFPIIS